MVICRLGIVASLSRRVSHDVLAPAAESVSSCSYEIDRKRVGFHTIFATESLGRFSGECAQDNYFFKHYSIYPKTETRSGAPLDGSYFRARAPAMIT